MNGKKLCGTTSISQKQLEGSGGELKWAKIPITQKPRVNPEQRINFWKSSNASWLSEQARKSSEDTQVSGYARFEKSLGRVSFGSKKFGPKIFLLIFSLNWIIFLFPRPKIFWLIFSLNWIVLRKHFFTDLPPPPPLDQFQESYPAQKWKIEWKFKSITNLRTDGLTDGRTDMGRC